MTYSSGGLIQATDYNGFVSTTSGANVNDVWGTGSADKGWGQSALSTVSATNTVTATQWASLVNTLSTMGSQTNTTLTSRTAPTAGQTISVLSAVNTDLTSVTTNRGNAAAIGSQVTTNGSSTKTTTTGTGNTSWTITFTNTITFPSADQARYFWNAGGLVRLDMSKSSTGLDSDADWNTFAGTVGTLYMSGRVNSAAQTIAGTSYTGFTRSGGSGTPSPNLTTTGWYTLTAGAAATTMWTLTNPTAPYTGDYISITAAKNAGATTLTLTTTWFSAARTSAGENTQITGGVTGPTVAMSFYAPSTTYLTNTWGTPTLSASNV